MNRWGYLVVAALIIALGVYAFSPLVATGDAIALWHGDTPDDFTIIDAEHSQEVRGYAMRIGGIIRRLDDSKREQLFNVISQISVPAKAAIPLVDVQQLSAYGIDRQHGLSAGDRTLYWGESGDHGYIWDGARILTITLGEYRALVHASQRLDETNLLPFSDTIESVDVDGLHLGLRDGAWRDLDHPQRPSLSTRASRLKSWIVSLTLDRFTSPPVSGPALLTMSFTLAAAVSAAPTTHHLAIYGPAPGDDGALVVIDDLPAQRISAARLATLRGLIADLHRDWLIDVAPEVLRSRATELVVVATSSPSFTVARRESSYRVDDTHWEISWQGGAEDASESALVRTLVMLCGLSVEHALPGPELAPASPFRKIFRMTMQGGESYTVSLDGLNVWTNDFHGRLSQPSPLQDLEPAALLDLALLPAAPERICKIQRISTQPPPLKEVVTRDDNGTWMRTYPVRAAADAVAIGRLARAVCESQAESARLTTDEDRQALSNPALILDIRLNPLAMGAPRMDISNERDTVPQNRGFSFYQDHSHLWRAIDVEGGVSYQVAPDLVELLSQPFQADALFPLVPTLVMRLGITTAEGAYTLERHGESWELSAADLAKPLAADPLEVRRYLRSLSELASAQRFPERELILPARAALTVVCTMPAVDGNEALSLTMSAPDSQGARISVASSSAAAGLPLGQEGIDSATATALLAPRSRFLLAPLPPAPAPPASAPAPAGAPASAPSP